MLIVVPDIAACAPSLPIWPSVTKSLLFTAGAPDTLPAKVAFPVGRSIENLAECCPGVTVPYPTAKELSLDKNAAALVSLPLMATMPPELLLPEMIFIPSLIAAPVATNEVDDTGWVKVFVPLIVWFVLVV